MPQSCLVPLFAENLETNLYFLPILNNIAGCFAFRFHSPLPFDSVCPVVCLSSSSHPPIAAAINYIVLAGPFTRRLLSATRDDMT